MAVDVRPFGELFAEPPRNGLTRPKAVRGSGVKMVNMGELFAHARLRDAHMDRVPLDGVEASRFLLKPGDLLFARQSLVLEGAGKCSVFLGDLEPVTFESHVTRVRLDVNKADPAFYFYYLQSAHGKAAIRSIVEQGAGAAGIRGSDLARLHVQWLPLGAQKSISATLGALDDKIELNRRMNRTLEAIARALFKSWFVDFDPVRAKMRGEKPWGVDAASTALFPDRLVESQIGEAPDGWHVGPLSRFVQILSGGTPRRSEPTYWNGGIPWFSVRDVPAESDVFTLRTEETITQEGVDNSAAQVLPIGTVIVSARGTVGKLAVVGVPMAMNQSCFGLRGKSWGPAFTYYALRHAVAQLQQHTHGSVFDTITRATFDSVHVVSPPGGLVAAFESVVAPAFARIQANCEQNLTLAAMRDALLPKLLLGKMPVASAETVIA